MRDVFKADKMHGELHCPANNPSSHLRTSWVAWYLGIAVTGVEALVAMGLVLAFM
jgi:hypothetical protein